MSESNAKVAYRNTIASCLREIRSQCGHKMSQKVERMIREIEKTKTEGFNRKNPSGFTSLLFSYLLSNLPNPLAAAIREGKPEIFGETIHPLLQGILGGVEEKVTEDKRNTIAAYRQSLQEKEQELQQEEINAVAAQKRYNLVKERLEDFELAVKSSDFLRRGDLDEFVAHLTMPPQAVQTAITEAYDPCLGFFARRRKKNEVKKVVITTLNELQAAQKEALRITDEVSNRVARLRKEIETLRENIFSLETSCSSLYDRHCLAALSAVVTSELESTTGWRKIAKAGKLLRSLGEFLNGIRALVNFREIRCNLSTGKAVADQRSYFEEEIENWQKRERAREEAEANRAKLLSRLEEIAKELPYAQSTATVKSLRDEKEKIEHQLEKINEMIKDLQESQENFFLRCIAGAVRLLAILEASSRMQSEITTICETMSRVVYGVPIEVLERQYKSCQVASETLCSNLKNTVFSLVNDEINKSFPLTTSTKLPYELYDLKKQIPARDGNQLLFFLENGGTAVVFSISGWGTVYCKREEKTWGFDPIPNWRTSSLTRVPRQLLVKMSYIGAYHDCYPQGLRVEGQGQNILWLPIPADADIDGVKEAIAAYSSIAYEEIYYQSECDIYKGRINVYAQLADSEQIKRER
jgi:hypothetical protein